MAGAPRPTLPDESADGSVERLRAECLAKMGLAFAVLAAGAAAWVLVYAFVAVWYLQNA